MTQKDFSELFKMLAEKFPEYDFQFDEKEQEISTKVSLFGCSGIWITVFNRLANSPESDGGKYDFGVCFKLKNANGSFAEWDLNELENKQQLVVECVEKCIRKLRKGNKSR